MMQALSKAGAALVPIRAAPALQACQISRPADGAASRCCLHSERRQSHVAASTAEAVAEAPSAEAHAAPELDISALDIRVGRILSAEKHSESDKLIIETIDVGEEEPRTIVSGLQEFVSAEALQGRMALVLCNLKARKLGGVSSNGMLLCASNAAHDKVETLAAPSTCEPGERCFFGDGNSQAQPDALSPNQVAKKKVWEQLQPDLHTSHGRLAMYKDRVMHTLHGPVTAPTLCDARIS